MSRLNAAIGWLQGSAGMLAAGLDPSLAAETLLQGLYNGYTLLAGPLFILAADSMDMGSLADRLLGFRHALGHVDMVSSLIFSGMSVSAVADAVGMVGVFINLMNKDGQYTPAYAAALTAATATIGPTIPPGLLMALCMGLMNAVMARRRNFPTDEATPLRALPGITLRAFPALMLPVILLSGFFGGVVTARRGRRLGAVHRQRVDAPTHAGRRAQVGVFHRCVSGRAGLP